MAIFRPSQGPATTNTPAATPLAAIAQLAPTHLVGSMIIFHRIYIGSIQFDITEPDLEVLFGQFGPIRTITMMQDPVNKRHRGYGFIEFETAEAAALAQTQLDAAELGGRTIKVGRPNNFPADLPPGVPRPLPNRIYIGNVHELVQEEELKMVCEAFGRVSHCHLAPDKATGGHRGYAYVEYEDATAALNAIAALNNFELAKRLLKVGPTIAGGPMPAGMASLHETPPSPLRTGREALKSKVPSAVLRAAQEINSSTLGQTKVVHDSTVMILRNLEDYANLCKPSLIAELEEDVAEECKRFGAVQACRVHLDHSNHIVTVYVKFSTTEELISAIKVMHLRWFGGRQIVAETFSTEAFEKLFKENL